MLMGRLFQSRIPMVTFVKRFGVLRRIPVYFAVNVNEMAVKQIKSMKYLVAEPWSTLKVIKRILNSIHRQIGNQ